MDKQKEFESELKRVAEFFEGNSKTDNCYFRLYTSKYANSKLDQKNLKASNFESTDLDESLDFLRRELLLHGQYSPKFWFIKLLSSTTDPNGITITIKNVLSEELEKENSFFNSNSIGSFGGGDMVSFQQKMLEKQNELEKQMLQERHNREIEKFEERLESLENSSKTIVDSITGFAESETGKLIVGSLIGLLSQKVAGQQQPGPQIKTIQESVENGSSKSNTDNLSVDGDVLESINTMKDLFGNDFSDVMKGLSAFCANNPAYAKQLMEVQKTNTNGQK